ncbi:MAG: hypothetical protein AAGI09_14945 [Pseudomonadota bacterium]
MNIPTRFDLSTAPSGIEPFKQTESQEAIGKDKAACRAKAIPLASLGRSEAFIARGFRAIAGFDLLWRKAKAAATQRWYTN